MKKLALALCLLAGCSEVEPAASPPPKPKYDERLTFTDLGYDPIDGQWQLVEFRHQGTKYVFLRNKGFDQAMVKVAEIPSDR